ncbi:PREDICTED: protein Star-like isoform X1 [Nicrophorus vespilloides]|uniref:Protein Star-like isoform X1 n=1 Tax=Nicrophorus vespilloides TaxID=110193 RepID=A0ABM1MQ12_NICVS|nr:PREDICTED: protein Star-like isoform X1 [Nicrophorus vespilloides]
MTKICNMTQQQQSCINAAPVPLPQLPPTPTKMTPNPPSQFALKKLLPITAFFMGFATVMTLLLIYMDNNALRHHQFNVNMTQDYELLGVSQDNPELISAIKQYFLKPGVEPHHKPIEYIAESPSEHIEYLLKILNNKMNGNFVEAGAYGDGKTSETEWLEKKLSWKGLLVQPDPRHFFNLKRHNRAKSQLLHGCLSPAPYPKEVSYHQEERFRNLFNTRVKCFPLYSLLLAMNMTKVDYLILETRGTELQVLETIPFERLRIDVIDVHLLVNDGEKNIIKEFLATKNYTLMQVFNTSNIYKLNVV